MPKTVATRYQITAFHHWTKKVNTVIPATVYQKKGEHSYSMVTYRGTSFNLGMAVCTGLQESGTPDIGIIRQIDASSPLRPCVVLHMAHVVYEPHIRAYVIAFTDQSDTRRTQLDCLTNSSPMDVLFYGSKKVLSQRHALV